MRTIFKYDANNFMKNEINEMPNKRRKRIFKLMNLLGEFSLITNLYVDCSEMDDNVKIITYDKDGGKITFFPRSLNKEQEDLVYIEEFKYCEAYSINKGNINKNNIELLKVGNVYEFHNGKVIINEKGLIEVLLDNGYTYIANLNFFIKNDFSIDFDSFNFLKKIRLFDDLSFQDFCDVLNESIINYFEASLWCIKEGNILTNYKIDYRNNISKELDEDGFSRKLKK